MFFQCVSELRHYCYRESMPCPSANPSAWKLVSTVKLVKSMKLRVFAIDTTLVTC